MNQLNVWYQRNIPGNPNIFGIGYGNGTYVAVGEGIFTSSDGITWTNRYPAINYGNLYDVTFDGSRFIAVGTTFGDFPHALVLISSDNGFTWSQSSSHEGWNLLAVASVGGTCVAVSGDQIFTSINGGQSWHISFSNKNSNFTFCDVCLGRDQAGHKLFVVVGYLQRYTSGYSFSSAASVGGLNWKVQTDGSIGKLHSVTYGNGIFVAVGNGRFYMSVDGLNWTGRSYLPEYDVTDITFAQNRFVAVGASGKVYDSPDGDNWRVIDIGWLSATLTDVHFCENTYVALAEPNIIIQSERFDQPFLAVYISDCGYGSVEIQPAGVRTESDWGATFPKGTEVTLTASGKPLKRYITDPFTGRVISIPSGLFTYFNGWREPVHLPQFHDIDILGNPNYNNPITLTMDTNKIREARFSVGLPIPTTPPTIPPPIPQKEFPK